MILSLYAMHCIHSHKIHPKSIFKPNYTIEKLNQFKIKLKNYRTIYFETMMHNNSQIQFIVHVLHCSRNFRSLHLITDASSITVCNQHRQNYEIDLSILFIFHLHLFHLNFIHKIRRPKMKKTKRSENKM